MNAAATGWRSLARSTRIGPPAPRKALAPPSQSSDFLNRGKTDWKSQPALPASAQPSYSARWPRVQTMALMLPDPPSTLPSARGMERPATCGLGS
jgi:hypothetical protein